jgi:glycosyltransferase involved in cell wall biosynthesis/predicted Ser/Thr protein kinase
MQFNPTALAAKQRHLDAILADPDRLARVVRALLSDAPAAITPLPRPWEPGGGASLFAVATASTRYFLKVKHLAVTVESKLEAEPAFSSEPSLRNEHQQLQRLAGQPFVPAVHGYAEDGDHAFLLLEWLTPFATATAALGAAELVATYRAIERAARALFERGLVHTDLHEGNVMFRDGAPVLVDFEEARALAQPGPFAESLDAVGRTALGDVGEMPAGDGRRAGLTCLARLRAVFADLVRARLEPLIQSCNFDSSCPFLTTLDHGSDERVYQTIQIPGLTIAGQRPPDDPRIPVIAAVAERLFDRPYTHLDVGSNIGMFNITMAQRPEVRRSFGVEAYDKYVELSQALGFLAGVDDAVFHCVVGGEDSLAERLAGESIDLVTIYSVYHHIRNKERFLADLAALAPGYVMLEMASQPECYEGRTWESEVERIAAGLGMPFGQALGRSGDYARPIVLLSREPIAADLLSRPPRSAAAAPVVPPAAPAPTGVAAEASRPGDAPRVSVVLPVYNHLRFLPAAIASVLAQTYGDFELVIVNDGSTDGTREYLDGLTDPRIVVVHQENRRLPGALNTGFAHARGELLTWISADNSCAPMFLAALVGALDRHPDAGFAYSAFAWIDDAGRITGIHRDQDVSVRSLLKQNPGIAAFMYRRAGQDAVGLYDPALDGAEDWDMWLRIVERAPAVYVPEILMYYRVHADSMTARQRERIFAASRQVVLNALARRGGTLDVEELFPTLAACGDRAEAELHACADFGTLMLQSPWAPAELSASFLAAACSVREEPAAVANYAIACGRLARWDQLARALDTLRGVAHTEVRRLVLALEAAASHQRADLVAAIQPFGIDKTGVELFERERALRRVWSLTAGDASPSEDVTIRTGAIAASAVAAGVSPASAPSASAVRAPSAVSPERVGGPAVSVIVPTFNRPEMLREALRSILAQTFRDFEIVVVNDHGLDVQDVIAELDHEGRIAYVRHAVNRGLAAARNSGLGVARGRFIAYLDDDDRFYPEHLATLVGALRDGGQRVVYGDALRVTQRQQDAGYVTVRRDRPYSYEFDRRRLLIQNFFPVLCVMHERECATAVGGFDESMTSHEDWELWLRMSARFPFAHVPSITCEFTHRIDGTSMTSSMEADYLRTAEIIYARSAADAAGDAEVLEGRRQFIGALRERVGRSAGSTAAAPSTPTRAGAASATKFDCSIVIPVYNRAELTEQCLVALARVTQGTTFEVILVDNGSTDATADLLAKLGGDVQVIRNQENRGFAVACNQGAQAARGRHVVFLNNDTIPLEGWLAPLVAELDADPGVAVVGSKLIFADGTVQHAGVVFSRELPLPFHAFYRAAATLPAVNRRRELRCVTAACMAVRRSVFDALGGFDEGYRNGFEDVDFCLRVAEAGHRIVYQPASTLYHLESQTEGRKVHDQANGRRLFERWQARWAEIGDEDVVLVPDGWCGRTLDDGHQSKVLALIADAADRARWEAVARTQRALLDGDTGTVRAMLTTWRDWPADCGVHHWVERLRRRFGVVEREAAALG